MPAKKKIAEQVAEVMQTGAEPPATSGGTRVVTDADLAEDRAFIEALGAAEADEPEATVAEEPTGSHEPVAEDAPADAPRTEADGQSSAVDQTGSPEPVARGGVNALVTRLLADPDLSYEAIVAEVVAAFPAAQTTARSVASTASVLRRRGTQVPMRRRGPKA